MTEIKVWLPSPLQKVLKSEMWLSCLFCSNSAMLSISSYFFNKINQYRRLQVCLPHGPHHMQSNCIKSLYSLYSCTKKAYAACLQKILCLRSLLFTNVLHRSLRSSLSVRILMNVKQGQVCYVACIHCRPGERLQSSQSGK